MGQKTATDPVSEIMSTSRSDRWRQQSIVFIDTGIVFRLRIERHCEVDFRMVFAQMRLHMQVRVLTHQRAGRFKLFRRGGDRKAGGDGIQATALAMPTPDQFLRVVIGCLRRVCQRFGRVAIHHHLAGDDAHVPLAGCGEQCVGTLGMHGAIGGHGGRALAQKFVQEEACDARRMV